MHYVHAIVAGVPCPICKIAGALRILPVTIMWSEASVEVWLPGYFVSVCWNTDSLGLQRMLSY